MKQPKVLFYVSKWVHVINGLSILCMLSSFIFAIVIYPALPDTIPIHFNSQGEVDGWGSKATIFLMPAIALLLFVPLYFLSKAPHVFNYPMTITEENAKRIYPVARTFMTVLNFEVVLLFTYFSLDMIGLHSGSWLLISVFTVPILTILIFGLVLVRLK